MQNAIEVRNLKVVFPDGNRIIRAVEGVDLTVKKGECLALVGESGCGKSMASLSCMKLQPSSAAVRLAVYLRGRRNRIYGTSDAGITGQ